MKVSLGSVLVWKYPGVVFSTEGDTIVAWSHPTIPQPDAVQLAADLEEYIKHLAANLYRKKRAAEYPAVGDQLDAIWKALSTLGAQLPKEAADMLIAIEAVKTRHPKP